MAVGIIAGTPITDAVDKDDHLEMLKAMARKLARQMDFCCDSRALPGLSDKLLKVNKEIRELSGKAALAGVEKTAAKTDVKKVTPLSVVQNKQASGSTGAKDRKRAKVS